VVSGKHKPEFVEPEEEARVRTAGQAKLFMKIYDYNISMSQWIFSTAATTAPSNGHGLCLLNYGCMHIIYSFVGFWFGFVFPLQLHSMEEILEPLWKFCKYPMAGVQVGQKHTHTSMATWLWLSPLYPATVCHQYTCVCVWIGIDTLFTIDFTRLHSRLFTRKTF